jgi:transposase
VCIPKKGSPRLRAFCLALVSVMQFAEHLSDRQEASAVRARIDWKYALSLSLDESGFHSSVRSRISGPEARKEVWKADCWTPSLSSGSLQALSVPARGNEPIPRMCVAGCESPQFPRTRWGNITSCTECCLRPLCQSGCAQHVKPEWFDRYGQRMEEYRLRHPTKASVMSSVPRLARMDSFCWLVSNRLQKCNGYLTSRQSKRCQRSGSNHIDASRDRSLA